MFGPPEALDDEYENPTPPFAEFSVLLPIVCTPVFGNDPNSPDTAVESDCFLKKRIIHTATAAMMMIPKIM